MKVFMSGDIYIKRGPEPYEFDDFYIEFMTNFLDDSGDPEVAEYLDEMLDPDLDPETEEILQELCEIGLEKNGEPCYVGCDDFWVCTVTDDIFSKEQIGLRLDVVNKYGDLHCDVCTPEELEEKYISLTSFLEQGEYIGRKFRRTKPLNGDDFTFVPDDVVFKNIDYTALYRFGDILLVYGKDALEENEYEYRIVDARYLEDGNYEFYGKVNEEFRDKPELYQAILKQTHKNKVKRYLR